MTETSRRQEARDRVLPTLDVFIQVLGIAKDTCGIPPAQIAFGSAGVLLNMIRVYSLFCEGEQPTHAHLGHVGQLSGLCRAWTELWECMSSAPPETEGENSGRTQRGRPRCDWRPNCVSQASDADDEWFTYQSLSMVDP
jgi:hypothetical protein